MSGEPGTERTGYRRGRSPLRSPSPLPSRPVHLSSDSRLSSRYTSLPPRFCMPGGIHARYTTGHRGRRDRGGAGLGADVRSSPAPRLVVARATPVGRRLASYRRSCDGVLGWGRDGGCPARRFVPLPARADRDRCVPHRPCGRGGGGGGRVFRFYTTLDLLQLLTNVFLHRCTASVMSS